jgi:hypothetical protein
VVLRKPKFAIATAAASVTTARLTPRTRSADTAVSSPSRTAAALPASGASGKPMPASTARCEIVKPATPARASCTTEIWPTKPVMTTSDSAISVPISEVISASRKSNGSSTSAAAQTAASGSEMTARRRGRGAAGSRRSTSSPRLGSRAPRRNIAAMMIANATSSCTPGSAVPPEVGNQDMAETYSISEYRMPMPRPTAQAIPNEVNRASSAAASAGTIWSGSVVESSWVIEAARIPTPPAISEAISVFAVETAFGDRPPSMAATSFSDAARVASPNRVHR